MNQLISDIIKARDVHTERIVNSLREKYREIRCKKGCTLCCERQDFVIDSIDALVIYSYLVDHNIWASIKEEIASYNKKECFFLKDNECTIYSARPMCCRAYWNVENECGAVISFDEGHARIAKKIIDTYNLSNVLGKIPEMVLWAGKYLERT